MLKTLKENKDLQKALGAGLIIIVLGLIGWFIVDRESGRTYQGREDNLQRDKDGDIGADIEGEAEINQIPITNDGGTASPISAPSLDRVVVFPSRFNTDVQKIVAGNISELVTQLKSDPDSFQAWADLAMQYKIIDDFEGAAEIWEFLNLMSRGNTVSRVNLGNLYHYDLKDFVKSEANFKEATKINNEIVEAYTGLFELYKYSYKTDTTLAEETLKDAIEALPQNIDLKTMLAGYYKEKDRSDDARALYIQAREQAQAVGNTQLVEAIDAELNSL